MILAEILLIFVAIILVLAAIIAMQSPEFRISRSATISAPVHAVFEKVNNLQYWNAWSPWAKLDPAAKNTFEGPQAGKGAVFKWSGNKHVGEGIMTIVESKADEVVCLQLEFLKPFKATSMAEFLFESLGSETRITWSMYGENNFIAKAMHLFTNCDKMMGKSFEEGLANLEALVRNEGHPARAAQS